MSEMTVVLCRSCLDQAKHHSTGVKDFQVHVASLTLHAILLIRIGSGRQRALVRELVGISVRISRQADCLYRADLGIKRMSALCSPVSFHRQCLETGKVCSYTSTRRASLVCSRPALIPPCLSSSARLSRYSAGKVTHCCRASADQQSAQVVAGSTGLGDKEASASLAKNASHSLPTLMVKIAQGAAVAALALALVSLMWWRGTGNLHLGVSQSVQRPGTEARLTACALGRPLGVLLLLWQLDLVGVLVEAPSVRHAATAVQVLHPAATAVAAVTGPAVALERQAAGTVTGAAEVVLLEVLASPPHHPLHTHSAAGRVHLETRADPPQNMR